MYCNHCGALMGGEDLVCRACGKSVAESRTAVVLRSRVPEHLHLLAIFWFVVAGFTLIPAAAVFVLGQLAATFFREGSMERAVAPLVFTAAGGVLLVIATVSFMTAWGLLKVRPWGRMLALVMGFIALLHPPFATALGIYTLFVLLPGAAGQEYDRMAGSRAQAERAAGSAV